MDKQIRIQNGHARSLTGRVRGLRGIFTMSGCRCSYNPIRAGFTLAQQFARHFLIEKTPECTSFYTSTNTNTRQKVNKCL